MGVDVEVLSPGDGQTYPKVGQTVVVHYTGYLESGQKFDSSRDRGVPFSFKIGNGEVIRGWDCGVIRMCVGERARLTCSPDFAYGSRGHPGISTGSVENGYMPLYHYYAPAMWYNSTSIPQNAVLIFDVELLKVEH